MSFIKFVFMVVFFPLTVVYYGSIAAWKIFTFPFKLVGAFARKAK